MQFRELTDRYQLQKILRSTRFGTLLQATDTTSGRTVVIKLVTVGPSPGLAAAAPEFERLAASLAELGHPNLPKVLDSGFTTDGGAFLALEPLEGRGLDAVTDVPPARLLAMVGQGLSGLEALAARGLAHHNVSPDNLFVVSAPGGERVVLLGLGTAVFRPRSPEAFQAENARFLAPELASPGAADWRADLYSLALTTCHALGATVGFGEAPVVQLPLAVSFELESDEALRQTLEHSLRQRPAERPTFKDFRQALRLAIGDAAVEEEAKTAVAPPPPPAPAAVLPFVPPAATPVAAQPVQPAAQALPPLTIPEAWTPSLAEPVTLSSPPPMLSSPIAPEFSLPDPLPPAVEEPSEEQGDVLSSVDDEILNALLSVPPPPPRPAGATAEAPAPSKVAPFLKKKAPAAPAQPAAATPVASSPLLRRPAVLGAIAGAVVLCIVAGLWFLLRPQSEPAPPPPPPPRITLPTAFSQPPVDRLEEAKLQLAQGEDLKARRAVRSILFGEQGLLSLSGCRELGAIEETLALAALERLPADLSKGLREGNVEILQAAVEAGAGQEAGLAADVSANFDRARGIVEAYEQARAAAARGDHVQVLEGFAALATLLPKAGDPEDLRGKAAQALEQQAESMVQNARYPQALALLGPIQRTWPDRPGLAERLASYQTYQANEKAQEQLLAALPGLERRKKPWDGLQMLNEVEPTPHLAPRLAEARKRLETLLAQLDQQPPQVVLRDGYLLEYSRGTVAELSFRATDDYQVGEVKVLARPQGGKYQEVGLETTRTGYKTVAFDPAFHRNGTVELYVVATDLSGHQGFLGSAEKPLVIKRKQGFERLIE
jgi:eukaryotic-like serine/threonine-protein kinase